MFWYVVITNLEQDRISFQKFQQFKIMQYLIFLWKTKTKKKPTLDCIKIARQNPHYKLKRKIMKLLYTRNNANIKRKQLQYKHCICTAFHAFINRITMVAIGLRKWPKWNTCTNVHEMILSHINKTKQKLSTSLHIKKI